MPSTTSIRRVAAIGATAALGIAVLAGCSSSSGSSSESASASASASESGSTQMLPPVIINVGETEATAKVGDFIDILVADNDIAGTTVDTDQPELVELSALQQRYLAAICLFALQA